MLTILELVSLAQLRTCKNRDSLYFARTRATRPSIAATLHRDLTYAYYTTVNLVTQLDDILNSLDHTPGPTQP